MSALSHLPRAVALAAEEDLAALDDVDLLLLVRECEEWQARAEKFKGDLFSPASHVVWDALSEEDRTMVIRSCDRVNDELNRRHPTR